MDRFGYINTNIERIKKEIELEIVPAFVIKNFAIYSRYVYYRKQGYNKTTSALYAGDDYKISDKQVFRIIKLMEKEV